ncbi:MAG: cyclic pyranopterin monophosphate synthase MoaC [Deltaproteobacteria bacterium]|nr:MAG: cyclic pyranopterin monophosphate synthase MoaC [Deltaproteobacteria bacterium]
MGVRHPAHGRGQRAIAPAVHRAQDDVAAGGDAAGGHVRIPRPGAEAAASLTVGGKVHRGALTHFDRQGRARMVEVGAKPETLREAVATGRVVMRADTAALVRAGRIGKGDVLGIARTAGIQGLKRTAELIPLCHPLRLTGVDLDLRVDDEPPSVAIEARVRAVDRTGVEMEALTAVAVAALTVYDMCKAVDRGMTLTDIRLEAKSGGKSGPWRRGP